MILSIFILVLFFLIGTYGHELIHIIQLRKKKLKGKLIFFPPAVRYYGIPFTIKEKIELEKIPSLFTVVTWIIGIMLAVKNS